MENHLFNSCYEGLGFTYEDHLMMSYGSMKDLHDEQSTCMLFNHKFCNVNDRCIDGIFNSFDLMSNKATAITSSAFDNATMLYPSVTYNDIIGCDAYEDPVVDIENNVIVSSDNQLIESNSCANTILKEIDIHVNSNDEGAPSSDGNAISDEEGLNYPNVNEDVCTNENVVNTDQPIIVDASDGKFSFRGKNSQIRKAKKMCSEQKRRRKLNEKLYSLRALVPTITKMDKASIVQDAVTYVKNLQKEVEKLKADVERLHRCYHYILEFHVVHIEGERYNLQLYCKKTSNVLAQLTQALESIAEFEILNGNLIAMHDRILVIISIKVNNGEFIKLKTIRQIVLNNIQKFGFSVAHVESGTSTTKTK